MTHNMIYHTILHTQYILRCNLLLDFSCYANSAASFLELNAYICKLCHIHTWSVFPDKHQHTEAWKVQHCVNGKVSFSV